VCGYWQSIHRLRTSAGYPGYPNFQFDGLIVANSPFHATAMLEPAYLSTPSASKLGATSGVDFRDYLWLFMTYHKFDYLFLHRGPDNSPLLAASLARAEDELAGAKVFEDPTVAVFRRARLEPPKRPTLLGTEGWLVRNAHRGALSHATQQRASVVLYNNRPDEPLIFTLRGAAFRKPRSVRVLDRSDGQELARWAIIPDRPGTYSTVPFRLPAGFHELTIACDGEERPSLPSDKIALMTIPYSLCVDGMSVEPASPALQRPPAPAGSSLAERTPDTGERRR
jgi:hypothetical protein